MLQPSITGYEVFLFCFVLVGLEFELNFTLAKEALKKQVLYSLSQWTSNPFCSGCFGDGSLKLFAWASLKL
jgi:hypothetical protein